jgi:hypothetical protein
MLPRADLNATRPLASVDAPAPVASSTDTRQEVYHRLTQIAIGAQAQAEVISQLDDGTFLVKLADTTARMALPLGTRVGDSLSMVLVAKEPRPTFLLTPQEGSTTASLSTAARLIDQLLQAADQEGAPTSVTSSTPLLRSQAGMDPKQIAAALRNSLEFSGLFYESHMQEWVSGGRSTTELQREPQTQIGAALRESGAATQPTPDSPELARLAASMRELGDGVHALMDLIRDAQLQPGKPATIDADVITRAQAALPPLDANSARLINLQLQTLEQQHVRWQGELWPGQPFDWEVGEDQRDGKENAAQPSSWTSVVRFRLPALGDISATLRLSGDRVQVQVNTPSPEVAASLRAQTGLLADALEAGGSRLDSLLVKNDETA